jgi:hypothetical protein
MGKSIILSVMPGLVPGIHVLPALPKGVDGRDKPGHDEQGALLFHAPSSYDEISIRLPSGSRQ